MGESAGKLVTGTKDELGRVTQVSHIRTEQTITEAEDTVAGSEYLKQGRSE